MLFIRRPVSVSNKKITASFAIFSVFLISTHATKSNAIIVSICIYNHLIDADDSLVQSPLQSS